MIPVIDISSLLVENPSIESIRIVSDQIKDACLKYGLFYVKNVMVDEKSAFAAADSFFSLDQNIKEAIPISPGGFTRGYVGMGHESGSLKTEIKEAFSYGFDWDPLLNPKNSLQGPNVWPQSFPVDVKMKMNAFYNQMIKTAHAIALGLFTSIGLSSEFNQFCSEGDTISLMRFFHYFAFTPEDSKIGSSEHSDWGFLTLILQQNGVSGLQFSPEPGVWADINPIPGTLLVNCGDYCSLLSNGMLKSPLHRVAAPKSLETGNPTERYSMVLFYYPNYNSKIPQLTSQTQEYSIFKNQKTMSSVSDDELKSNFGDYILDKWSQVYR